MNSSASLHRPSSVRLRCVPSDHAGPADQAAVLRVLGRYQSHRRLRRILTCCRAPARHAACKVCAALNSQLESAYTALTQLPPQGWLQLRRVPGCIPSAVRWQFVWARTTRRSAGFSRTCIWRPWISYVRAAYADLLLRQGRPADVLALLQGQESLEPLLLRIAIAQHQLHDPRLAKQRSTQGGICG